MTYIVVGDCRVSLKRYPDRYFHMIVTSPPYWGMRDYGLPLLVWDGEEDCPHRWGDEQVIHQRGQVGEHSTLEGGLQARGSGRPQKLTTGQWCQNCGAWKGSLGHEPTPDLYVRHLVDILRQGRRVLRDDGTLWLNLGDSYAGSWGNYGARKGKQRERTSERWHRRAYEDLHNGWDGLPTTAHPGPGLKPKDLVGIPWRVALALQADGWWLRSDIIWQKPNALCESVQDRPTRSYEHLFLLAKARRYYYDAFAIREPCQSGPSDIKKMEEQKSRIGGKHTTLDDPWSAASQATHVQHTRAAGDPTGRNKRDVWTISTGGGFKGAHFATFPKALVEPCIKAGTSEWGCCPECGTPWERVVRKVFTPQEDVSSEHGIRGVPGQKPLYPSSGWQDTPRGTTAVTSLGFRPACSCYDDLYRAFPRTKSARKRHQQDLQDSWYPRARRRPIPPGYTNQQWDPLPCRVLDMFGGAGTTGLVAERLGQDCTLMEIKPEYAKMAQRHILDKLGPMFTTVRILDWQDIEEATCQQE